MLMAALPPNRSSVSSELSDMARLREAAITRGAKDREWQQQCMLNIRSSTPIHASSQPIVQKEDLSLASLPLPSDDHSSPRPSSASSLAPSAMLDSSSPQSRRTRRVSGVNKRSGKIRRHRLAKETEAELNAAVHENDLAGTTAAQSRKMTPNERDIMLHKRRLRNRQSAARSREKQRKTIADLAEELDVLTERTEHLTKSAASIQATCHALVTERDDLRAENERLRRENDSLRSSRSANSGSLSGNIFPMQGFGRNSSFLQLSLSTDQLEALNTQSDPSIFNPGSSLLRIPSLGILRGFSEIPKPTLRKTDSVLDRILDGSVKGPGIDSHEPNPILTTGTIRGSFLVIPEKDILCTVDVKRSSSKYR